MDPEDDEIQVVEKSPNNRYLRYTEILGSGAFKIVYKGFDVVDGIEIAWNQISLNDDDDGDVLLKSCSEAVLLKSLDHENVIKCYCYWVDGENKNINIITELFSSGSLRQYRNRHKVVDTKTIKNWSKQILLGLHYLHSRDMPIIHRDLKCDNIFVNGNRGEVKIGDLGLATTIQKGSPARMIVGTPAFMAPDYYDEEYDELVDIYAFGMCVLEMVTCERPYSECENAAQIYRKVTTGVKPAAFGKVKDSQVREFIEKCLVSPSLRLPAVELLKDPFFNSSSFQVPMDVDYEEESIISDISILYNSTSADEGANYREALTSGQNSSNVCGKGLSGYVLDGCEGSIGESIITVELTKHSDMSYDFSSSISSLYILADN